LFYFLKIYQKLSSFSKNVTRDDLLKSIDGYADEGYADWIANLTKDPPVRTFGSLDTSEAEMSIAETFIASPSAIPDKPKTVLIALTLSLNAQADIFGDVGDWVKNNKTLTAVIGVGALTAGAIAIKPISGLLQRAYSYHCGCSFIVRNPITYISKYIGICVY
jgi:hypothetical protein